MQSLEIIKQTIGEDEINAVNARELYEYLEVKTAFKDWIVRRLEDTQAEENFDYIMFEKKQIVEANADKSVFSSNLSKNANDNIIEKEYAKGRPSKEYIITLDLAKELSMLEKSKKGKEIRRHFIEFEKKGVSMIDRLKNQIRFQRQKVKELNRLLNETQELLDVYSKREEARYIDDDIARLNKRKELLIKEGYYCGEWKFKFHSPQ